MRVIELNHTGGDIARTIQRQRRREAARTGLHVSTIIQDILRTLAPRKYNRATAAETMFAYQEFGSVFEDLLARQLARRLRLWVKPDPRTYRGIIGSPDGWDQRTRTLDEIKATWVSETDFFTADARGHIVEESEKFMAYRLQFLFYALAFRARRVKLHVLFINGKYPRGGGPIPSLRTFIFRFSQRELDENYRQLAVHAVDRGWLHRKYLAHSRLAK